MAFYSAVIIRGYFRVILIMVNVLASESIKTMFRNSDFLDTLVDIRPNCVMLESLIIRSLIRVVEELLHI